MMSNHEQEIREEIRRLLSVPVEDRDQNDLQDIAELRDALEGRCETCHTKILNGCSCGDYPTPPRGSQAGYVLGQGMVIKPAQPIDGPTVKADLFPEPERPERSSGPRIRL